MPPDTLQKGTYVEKRFRADPGDVEVKEPEGDSEEKADRKQIRMPVSSTAQDRDGDQFSEDGLEDLKQQLNDEKIPMFLDHGRGSRGSYYGTLGIVGRWDAAEIEQEGDLKVLYATGTPTDANPDAEDAVKLIEDDMPVGASVGFRVLDYDGDRQDGYEFHKSDLLETSLVGIPSNPETVNAGPEAGAVAAKGGVHGRHAHPARAARGMWDQRVANSQVLDDGLSDGQQHLQIDMARDAPTDTMDDDNPDHDPDLEELRETVSEQTETVGELTDSINSLVDSLDEERHTDPEDEGEKTASEPGDGDESSKDAGDDRRLSVVLDEDADEKAVEEFETLKEHAGEDGEVDLADSETRLFASEDETDDNADSGGNGGLI